MKYCDFTIKNSPLASKTDWQSESKSAERKRCTETIANGWQLHRTGIEPMSIAWKATMLPLHQRCSHQELWLYNEKRSSCVKNWLTIGEKKCREKTLHPNNRQRITIASNGNRTHVNSLEGYYATTTPTMLTSRVVIKQWETNWLKIGEQSAERERSTKTFTDGWQLHRTGIEPMSKAWKATMLQLHQRCSHQELWLYNEKRSSCVKNWLTIGEKKCREKTLHQNNRQRITIASYGNRTHVNSLEGFYATTTPTMLTSRVVIIHCIITTFDRQSVFDTRGPFLMMRKGPLVSKTDRRSERKSAERKRCTKTIANGSQLNRTGIEPMSIAWKATMLPLHQRCSHELWWRYKE